MEEQAETKVPVEGESISDIQNYLASFNKEIQDGTQSVDGSAENGTVIPVTTVTTAGETYYVTDATATHVSGYQAAFESTVEQFNGGDATFYHAGTEYYATDSAAAEGAQFAVPVQAFQTATAGAAGITVKKGATAVENAALLGAGVTLVTDSGNPVTATSIPIRASTTGQPVTVALSGAEGQEGIQRIVLATASDPHEVNESEATEISVTIPAALAGQAGPEHLLRAVDAQTTDAEQAAFVAMQPDGQQVVVSSSGGTPHVVTVSGNNAGIAALISQAEAVAKQGQSSARQNAGRAQTIRMVVQQPDGTERQQEVEVPTSDVDVPDDVSGATLVAQELAHGCSLEMMANLAEQTSEGEVVTGLDSDDHGTGQQVLLNSGNTYQTVTIVPSESNPGEVSYVLIVSQPDDDKGSKAGEDIDMSVYDFNEGEQQGGQTSGDGQDVHGNGNVSVTGGGSSGTSTKSPRVVKVSTKKSQSVTQAHMCNYCNYTSPKRYLLSRHMKSHSEERPHKCSVCERGFKTLASLQNHVNTHTGTRPHQCKECESAFTTSGELVRHVRYKHTHEKPHRCTECDYASVELSKLKRHMRCHTGERPYQCPHCTYASPDTYKLKRHLRIHTGEKPYECDVCHARFTQSNSLKAHKLIHTGNKPIFQCELCPTTCGRKTDLRIHVQKLHTSDKPLKCRRCGKSFPDRYTYKVHSKTHEGEKCFKCDLCPYASISQRHLESHMLIHTDQKPYQCDQCEQAFRQKQLLKRHKNLYHDPNYVPPTPKEKTHECPECGRAFRHKGNLIRHMAIHDPEATQQEKEAAMQVTHRRQKKRINEDGVEEEYTEEEEDDFDDDIDDDDLDEGHEEISIGRQITTADGQQVVVLEVIQLQGPEGEQQAVAVLAGEGMEMVDESGQVTGTATVVNADGSASLESANDSIEGMGTTAFIVEPHKKTGKRGSRLKVESMGIEETGNDGEEGEVLLTTNSRPVRGRRRKADEDNEYIYMTPKKGRRSGTTTGSSTISSLSPRSKRARSTGGEEVEELEPIIPSEEEIARREAEAEKRRQEQKQRDLEECFGFKDEDDEDDATNEGMTSGEHVDTSATESAIRLLAAMQSDEPDQE